MLPRSFQRFDQEEDFSGLRVVQFWGFGEGPVTAAIDDTLEGMGKSLVRGVGIGTSGELLEEGRGFGRVAGEHGLSHGEGDATVSFVVLAAVAAVGKVAG
jgi:hypothetical protein